MSDPIVKEVRTIRDAHAAQFNFDLKAIYADLKRQETESDHPKAPLPPEKQK